MDEPNFNYNDEDKKWFLVLYIFLLSQNEMNKN